MLSCAYVYVCLQVRGAGAGQPDSAHGTRRQLHQRVTTEPSLRVTAQLATAQPRLLQARPAHRRHAQSQRVFVHAQVSLFY